MKPQFIGILQNPVAVVVVLVEDGDGGSRQKIGQHLLTDFIIYGN
ncbi:hypothetical protein LACPH_000834 [Lacticaseibacillus parahuelsenbergensis]|uniref:Uncharacterized protein n=1 Tax=Lacticaseibacillus parahuelsenbergensis TaxID=3068305 RepID=A0ABY9L509_9LACO|nr:hypothetical protein [Lacticaseibacillus sp. NCIMB 15471]WLV78814.1 hypothetical protein LACPH_000834 [Lacticaseibacillus sp. NCIMB 15471]